MPGRFLVSDGLTDFAQIGLSHGPAVPISIDMSERREHTRFKALGLSTPFGEVMDVSDSGLGVFRKGSVSCSVGDEVTLFISHGSGEVELNARVARIEYVGLFRHEIGFEFVDADEETLTRLWSLTDSACSEFAGPRCYVAA